MLPPRCTSRNGRMNRKGSKDDQASRLSSCIFHQRAGRQRDRYGGLKMESAVPSFRDLHDAAVILNGEIRIVAPSRGVQVDRAYYSGGVVDCAGPTGVRR